ncbi:MAG: redoxin domain-containing protein [Dehalococcoidia bacterium]|nr:redoxin domain-containing protein [Dehalococcoidia bacterium]
MTEAHVSTRPTVIYDDKATTIAQVEPKEDDLWLGLPDLVAATGWDLKPEGVCRGELCVPIPDGNSAALVKDGSAHSLFNLTAFARHIEQPYVHDAAHNVWVFGPQARDWRDRLTSARAPDFTLSDLGGDNYSLSNFHGKKVILAFWASW